LLLELHPTSIAESPLCDLLRQLADGIAARAQVPIAMDIDCECGDLPTDVKIVLYRTAQEALNNVARHSRATQAAVRLRCRTEGLSLVISDDGCGFEAESVAPDHLGLGIMRERSRSIGASMAIASEVGHGTVVTVEWVRPVALDRRVGAS
jgi:two-component system nitrate/nitrite sensor histidine kinase NarX